MHTVEAIYAQGVFRPVEPVALAENQRVRLQVDAVPTATLPGWLEELRAERERLAAKYGQFPDSSEIIAQDRRRDG